LNWIKDNFIKNIKTDQKSLKNFNILFTIIFVLLSLFALKKHYNTLLSVSILGSAIFLFASIVYQKLTLVFYYPWMVLANILSFIMQRIILSIIFYLLIFPLSIILKLSGKNFLTMKPDKKKNTYWVDKDKNALNPKFFEKQYN